MQGEKKESSPATNAAVYDTGSANMFLYYYKASHITEFRQISLYETKQKRIQESESRIQNGIIADS